MQDYWKTLWFISALVLVLTIFTIGWWLPNASVWQKCGASTSFSLIRGVFEKPDVFTCIGLRMNG